MNWTLFGSRSKPAKNSQRRKVLTIFAPALCLASILTTSLASVALAQSASAKKDIPAIAKSAREAVLTIIMLNDDKPIAQGTGFLVTPDGAIVTNYHVIATGNAAVVKFVDGTVSPVDGVLAANKVRDLAIIKIHGRTFRTLTLGNSDQIQVGEEVVAIGNPLGLELSVSNGILSGIRRDEKEGGKFLQITAPISHGSSGGPLFNMSGEVVGITSMYFEGGENLNFAVPVNDAKQLLRERSATLRELPNEPEKSQTAQTPPTTQKDYSFEQKWCDEQAEEYARYVVKKNSHVKYAFKTGRAKHYEPEGNKCFVEIVLDYGPGKNPRTDIAGDYWSSGREYFIEDATLKGAWRIDSTNPIEKAWLGYFYTVDPKHDCFIEGVKCQSEEEFNDRAMEYFGLVQPTASETVLPFGTPAASNNHVPPNTKISAAGLDPAKATNEQVFEDLRYCTEYPNDGLQEPNGQQVRCRDLIAAMQAQGAHCATGLGSKTEACRNLMAWFATLNIGRP